MVIAKTLGYVFAGLGLVGVAAWSIPQVKAAIPQLGIVSDIILISVSAVLVVAGLFLIMRSSGSRQAREVPIYHGKNIVGYRRH